MNDKRLELQATEQQLVEVERKQAALAVEHEHLELRRNKLRREIRELKEVPIIWP